MLLVTVTLPLIETKARLVAESFSGKQSVSELARQNGLRSQQLFGWRHQARQAQLTLNGEGNPARSRAMASKPALPEETLAQSLEHHAAMA
jgi:transposase-like protein